MSPEKKREKIKVDERKSLQEMTKRERICPLWISEAVVDIWHPDKVKKEVTMCVATQRMVCLRDYRHHENCEYYLQYIKSDRENTPLGSNTPRYPVSLLPEDLY